MLISRSTSEQGIGDIKANFLKRNEEFPYPNVLVAEDIIGGLFAYLDNGKLGYFAPYTLDWEEDTAENLGNIISGGNNSNIEL